MKSDLKSPAEGSATPAPAGSVARWLPAWLSDRSPLAIDIGLFSLITIVATWPQVVSLRSLPEHHDALFNVWRLGWIAHALVTAPQHLFDANIFHPSTGTLAYSDAVLFQGLMGAPLIWSGLSPVVVCNLLVMGSFVFAGVAATLLARDLTGHQWAARVAGLVFAIAPFRFDHYFHLELLWGGWLPLVVRYGLRVIASWRPRDVVLCAGSLLGQVLSCVYYGVIAGTFTAGGALLALVYSRSAPLRRRLAMLALGALVLAPPLAAYGREYLTASRTVGARSVSETRRYGATWTNYLASPGANRLYGWTEARWGANERQLFPGLLAVALALVACVAAPRRVALPALACLVVTIDLARGMDGYLFPALRILNPAVAGLRVPARFHVFSMLALAMLAAAGMAALLAPQRRAWMRALAGVATIGLLAEYAMKPQALAPVDRRATPVLASLARDPRAVVVHLPLPRPWELPGREAYYTLLSMQHWRPLVNGYSGFYPPAYLRACLRASERSLTRSIDAVLALGATHIFVHLPQWPAERQADVAATFIGDRRLSPAGEYDIGGEKVLLLRAAPIR